MPATKIFAGMARSYTMGIIGVFSKNWNYDTNQSVDFLLRSRLAN